MVTVTAAVVVLERVAVKVIEPDEFSVIEDVSELSVTVGAVSLSVRDIDTCCVPLSVADPPETLPTSITAVKSPS